MPWLTRLKVQQKIAWGYGIALGVALLGTGLGIVLADVQQRQADAMGQDALEEINLITRLQVDLLQTLSHQRQVEILLLQPRLRQQEYEEWEKHYRRFRQSWEQFKTTEGGTKGQEAVEREGEVEAIENFLEKYEGVPEAYIQTLDRLLFRLNQTTFTNEEVLDLRADLIVSEQSLLLDRLDDFSEEITTLLAVTQEEYEDAQAAIKTSSALRLQVIGLSIIGSVAIAVLLSILTSRAIARPIQELTQVAQRSLNESNFDLQAAVTTKDEIGTLATSFNQLIASVKQLLGEQQGYSQMLEMKVAERTQELSSKTVQLQELLEQLHQSQLQIIQNEKMSSLGQLVAGIAHEINNPVGFIHGNLEYVQGYVNDLFSLVQLCQTRHSHWTDEIDRKAKEIDLEFLQEDFPKLLNSMEMGTDRIREIVLSLRQFSRMDEAEFKAVDLHEGIDSTLLILGHRLKAQPERPAIEVIRSYGKLPLVECYGGQMNQVFMNILANAIDAIDDCSREKTYKELQDHPIHIAICTTVVSSQWVNVEIADNGVGIPESVQKQIFNPFFTTKAVGKGTGMGLAISYQIVTEKHGGKLKCDSQPGSGTKFTIQIPVRQEFGRAGMNENRGAQAAVG